jgi:hypothetical protein
MQKEALTLCDIGGQLGTMDIIIIYCAVVFTYVYHQEFLRPMKSHLAMYIHKLEGKSFVYQTLHKN